MKLKLTIGNKILEFEAKEPKEFLRIASVLRRYCQREDARSFRADWRALAHLSEFVEELKSINPEKSKELKRALLLAAETTPSVKFKEDKVLVALKDVKDAGIWKEIKVLTEDSVIGPVEIAYLVIPLSNLPRIINSLPERARKALERALSEAGEARIEPADSRHIAVRIPLMFSNLAEEIKRLGEVSYYIQTEEGEMQKIRESYVAERVENGCRVVILPNYATKPAEDAMRSKGVAVTNNALPRKKEISVKRAFELFQHQKEAIEKWLEKGWGTIVVPTGGGKTFIGMAAIDALRLPTIIFVPNKILLWQWRDRIAKYLSVPESQIGVLGGGESMIKDITVATYQSGVRKIDQIARRFWLAIFDEAHHVPAKTFKEVALYLAAPYRMALSATPKRYDGNEILLFQLVGDIVYEIKYQELVRMGLLAPVAVRKIYVPLLAGMKVEYDKMEREVDEAKNEKERRKKLLKLIEIARDNPLKLPVIKEIVKRHANDKMFIFAGSIKFAKKIAETISGIVPAAVLTAESSEEEEKKIARDFQSGKIRALILVKKGEEGLDVGDASVAIIAGGSKQVREFIQRVGRVLRGGEDKLAWVYEIVTRDTVEEKISRARRARELVRGIEDYVRARFGVEPFKVVKWSPLMPFLDLD